MTSRPLVIYHHVPKTGGGTIHAALADRLGSDLIYWHLIDGVFFDDEQRILEDEERYWVVGGHIPYQDIVKVGFRRPLIHVGLVRDPIALTMSFANWVHQRPKHPNHTKVNPGSCDFRETSLYRRLHNMQMYMLTGTIDLEKAKRTVRRERYILAAFERLDEMIARLFGLFDIDRSEPAPLPKVNQGGRYRHRYNVEDVRMVNEANVAEDQKFYDFIANESDGWLDNVAARIG